ncbi:MAG: ABC transporter substrate-binding protein [Nocardioides sp.]
MRRSVLVPVGLALALVLAACGSNLDPAALEGTGTTSSGQQVVSAGGTPVEAAPGAPGGVTGADPVTGSGALPEGSAGEPANGAPAPAAGDGAEPPAGQPAPEENEPAGDVEAADCAGFQNGPGMTDDTITIGNAADVSGPVPGLFESSQIAAKAYVNYFNSTGQTICGRKLEMVTYDSRTDASADQQAYAAACEKTFAMVGAMGAFDSGGAATAQKCGLPDIRAIVTTATRSACTTCYAAQPAGSTEFQNAVPDFIKRNTSSKGQKAAMLYLSAGAASENGQSQAKFGTKRGLKYVYVGAIDTAEFNYVPFVQALKDKGVESVQFVGANPMFVRLVQTMDQQNYEPEVLLLDPTAYSKEFTDAGGEAAIGTFSFLNFTPFEEAASNAEVNLYLSYIQQVKPGTEPDFFGLFAWSAARLFVEQATKLGGELTRESLVASMRSVKNWTANDLHAPMRVGEKRIADCWRFVQWTGSVWKPIEGRDYQCNGTTS